MDRRVFLSACLAAGGLSYVPRLADRYRWVSRSIDTPVAWLQGLDSDGVWRNIRSASLLPTVDGTLRVDPTTMRHLNGAAWTRVRLVYKLPPPTRFECRRLDLG